MITNKLILLIIESTEININILDYYLENEKFNTTPVMYKTHQQEDDTDSVKFIGKLLNHLPVKTEFWGTKKDSYEKFESLDDLITEKNNIAATKQLNGHTSDGYKHYQSQGD